MDLQHRVERLEQENRRLKVYALGALALFGRTCLAPQEQYGLGERRVAEGS